MPRSIVTYAAPAPQQTLSAVFYFPWHIERSGDCGSADCSTPASALADTWCCCVSGPKPGNPEPVEGFYGSDDVIVTGRHMDVIAQHGIDVVGTVWTGQTFVENNLLNAVVPSLAARGLRYALLYDFAIRYLDLTLDFDRLEVRTRFINDMTRFASHPSYFQNASYLKLGNRPVVYFRS